MKPLRDTADAESIRVAVEREEEEEADEKANESREYKDHSEIHGSFPQGSMDDLDEYLSEGKSSFCLNICEIISTTYYYQVHYMNQ